MSARTAKEQQRQITLRKLESDLTQMCQLIDLLFQWKEATTARLVELDKRIDKNDNDAQKLACSNFDLLFSASSADRGTSGSGAGSDANSNQRFRTRKENP